MKPKEQEQEKAESVVAVDLDAKPQSVKEGVLLVRAHGERIKEAGWAPVRDMVGSYVNKVVDAVKGLADGFEGQSKPRE